MSNCIPCPFCGWRNVHTESDRGRKRNESSPIDEWFVFCPNCGARGPAAHQYHQSKETCKNEAAALWNRRVR